MTTTAPRTINEYRDKCHNNARTKGWHDKPVSFGESMALLHSEISEALECYRNGDDFNDFQYTDTGKPIGIPSELVDVFIRLMDTCGLYGIDIQRAIDEKIRYNAQRTYRHGGKKL